ncbi:MAG: hypothetical protein OCD03_11320 [Hyphomicrobiales bacterium]
MTRLQVQAGNNINMQVFNSVEKKYHLTRKAIGGFSPVTVQYYKLYRQLIGTEMEIGYIHTLYYLLESIDEDVEKFAKKNNWDISKKGLF